MTVRLEGRGVFPPAPRKLHRKRAGQREHTSATAMASRRLRGTSRVCVRMCIVRRSAGLLVQIPDRGKSCHGTRPKTVWVQNGFLAGTWRRLRGLRGREEHTPRLRLIDESRRQQGARWAVKAVGAGGPVRYYAGSRSAGPGGKETRNMRESVLAWLTTFTE